MTHQIGRRWMSVSSVFAVFHTVNTSRSTLVSFWPIEHVELLLNSQWEKSLWLFFSWTSTRQSQGGVEMALLILHLNLTWAFQYANIFIRTWPSGVKKVKMVLKHFFVYRMCIHIPSFAFPNDKYRLLPPAGIGIIPLTQACMLVGHWL